MIISSARLKIGRLRLIRTRRVSGRVSKGHTKAPQGQTTQPTNPKRSQKIKYDFFEIFLVVKLVSDGSSTNATRLGAIGSIHFAAEKENLSEKPLLVVGGDTLLFPDFPLERFINQSLDSEIDVAVTGQTPNTLPRFISKWPENSL